MNKNPPKTNWAETIFSRKWGILAIDLAAQDGVTPDAIHMRVLNFGNPFQRKAKPSKWEELYSKSLCELATELGMHPMSIAQRHQKLGNVYLKPVNLSREPNRKADGETSLGYTQSILIIQHGAQVKCMQKASVNLKTLSHIKP